MGEKKKFLWILPCLVLAGVLAGLSIPRVASVETVLFSGDVSDLSPGLREAYDQRFADSDANVFPYPEIQVVTVKSLWGNWQCQLLPCTTAAFGTVPMAGSADWTISLSILSSWDQEPPLSFLLPFELEDVSLTLNADRSVLVSQQVQSSPTLPMQIQNNTVTVQEPLDLKASPQLCLYYSVGAAVEQPAPGSVGYTWHHTITMGGKPVFSSSSPAVLTQYDME